MASKATNPLTRLKENILGTPEQNRMAQERMDAASKRKKEEKEKEKEAEEKTKMAKGGAVKKKKPAVKMSKGGLSSGKQSPAGKATKTPLLAIMIGMPKAPKAKKK